MMFADETSKSGNDDPATMYAQASELARRTDPRDLALLLSRLTDTAFLEKIDSPEAYEGNPIRLRMAGILQILAENESPPARAALVDLTRSPAFLDHPARVELLIRALTEVRPSPHPAVVFWDAHCQPEDGYSSVTVWALMNNGSPPALDLFKNKMLDERFPEEERRYWLTACVLEHRNDLPLLQVCRQFLDGPLEETFRLLLIDVLFDYKPDDWYGAGYWYTPPDRHLAATEALQELLALGETALASMPLTEEQRERVKLTMRELEQILQGQ